LWSASSIPEEWSSSEEEAKVSEKVEATSSSVKTASALLPFAFG